MFLRRVVSLNTPSFMMKRSSCAKTSTGSSLIPSTNTLTQQQFREKSMLTSSHLDFRLLTPEYVTQAAVLATQTFTTAEPLSLALNFTPLDIYYFMEHYAKIAARDGLGAVAVDRKSNMVVSAVIGEDLVKGVIEGAKEIEEHYSHNSPLSKVFGILDHLHEKYWELNIHHSKESFYTPENIGKVLHIYVGASYQFARRGGASFELSKFLLKNVRERGFTMALSESTSAYSQGLRRKMGFESKASISYSDEETRSKFPFTASIEAPHESVEMMWCTDLHSNHVINSQC